MLAKMKTHALFLFHCLVFLKLLWSGPAEQQRKTLETFSDMSCPEDTGSDETWYSRVRRGSFGAPIVFRESSRWLTLFSQEGGGYVVKRHYPCSGLAVERTLEEESAARGEFLRIAVYARHIYTAHGR